MFARCVAVLSCTAKKGQKVKALVIVRRKGTPGPAANALCLIHFQYPSAEPVKRQ